jgi:hypothetical protein
VSTTTQPLLRRVRGRHSLAVWLIAALVVAAAAAVAVDRALFSESTQAARPDLQWILDGLVTGDGRVAPGVTAHVSGPQGTWVGSAGLANVKTGEPMRPELMMHLDSNSKAWTATLILQLVGEGAMNLDDSVERWLPSCPTATGSPSGSCSTTRAGRGLLDEEGLRSLQKGPFCRYLSPLPDSNRGPPPYHGGFELCRRVGGEALTDSFSLDSGRLLCLAYPSSRRHERP